MSSPTIASLLIFDKRSKQLLFKILTGEFSSHLKQEIISSFGEAYILEKNKIISDLNQDEEQTNTLTEASTLQEESKPDDPQPTVKPPDLKLTDELISEYFSPLISSYEFSKDLNYTYEYALFNKPEYMAYFYSYKECIILTIFDSNRFELTKSSNYFMKYVYSEYYSSWCCKSLISLFKYKFSICLNEKCLSKDSKKEIKRLFLKWCNYFQTEQIYFLEAIEQIEVNDDIKIKCEKFMERVIDFLQKTDPIMNEFDLMSYEESITNVDTNDFPFNDSDQASIISSATENNKNDSANLSEHQIRSQFANLENFFTDLTQINKFILVYGNKLLYQNNVKPTVNRINNNKFPNNQIIDSSSIFMLILESVIFLNFENRNDLSLENEFDGDSKNYYDEDSDSSTFKSVSSSLEASLNAESITNIRAQCKNCFTFLAWFRRCL